MLAAARTAQTAARAAPIQVHRESNRPPGKTSMARKKQNVAALPTAPDISSPIPDGASSEMLVDPIIPSTPTEKRAATGSFGRRQNIRATTIRMSATSSTSIAQ